MKFVERETVAGRCYGSGYELLIECECGKIIYEHGYIHARLVDLNASRALCGYCKRMVKMPIQLPDQTSISNPAKLGASPSSFPSRTK